LSALFALGIGTQPSEVPTFLEAFARLPWKTPPSSIAAVDERTIAFMVLVHHLSYAALARAQRMRLQRLRDARIVTLRIIWQTRQLLITSAMDP
jgi:hypothetical protein